MAIITISRGTFAGGERLAERLGAALGYRVISREALYREVKQRYGFSGEELADAMDFAPSRFDPSGDRRRMLFVAVQAALCRLVQPDQAVYHGQAGHLLLPGISHVLRVRMIAPRSRRIRMAMEREGISHYEAVSKIDRVDAERTRWTQFVFGVNWADPAIYDLVLNLEFISVDEAAELVTAAARLPTFCASEGSRAALDDLALESRVRATLVTNPETAELDLKVRVAAGTVELVGVAGGADLARVATLVEGVEGVQQVRLSRRKAPTGPYDPPVG